MKKTVSLKLKIYLGLVALGYGFLSRGIEAMYESKSKPRKLTVSLRKKEIPSAQVS